MKRVWRNLSKGKMIVGVAVLCLAVVLGYFGFHRLTARADQFIHRGVLNEIEELPPGTWDEYDEGSEMNPFLFLEIVPSVDRASIGYMIDGCEPIDFDTNSVKKGPNDGYEQAIAKYSTTGFVMMHVFDDEYEHFYGSEEDKKLSFPGGDDVWKHAKEESLTMYGYYEKVEEGEGNFVQDANVQDETGVFGQEYWVPGFREVGFDSGVAGADYVWVSCVERDREWNDYLRTSYYIPHAKKNTKKYTSTDPNALFAIQKGDRIYAVRKGTTHYWGSEQKIHGTHRNDFLRTSLGPSAGCYTRKEIKNFNIVIKTIEPKELSEHPEWIDYADFIVMTNHASTFSKYWDDYPEQRRIKRKVSISTRNFSDCGQDFSWTVARKLFMKVNAMEAYDGNGKYRFAPMLLNFEVVTTSANVDAPSGTKSSRLDYMTMTSPGLSRTDGSSTNIWKFILMNCSMDQEYFYNLFFKPCIQCGGKSVIQDTMDGRQGEGFCLAQDEYNGKYYWTYNTFMPVELDKFTDITSQEYKDLEKRYNLHTRLVFGNGDGNTGLNGATFMFNADNLLTDISATEGTVTRDKYTENAFDWFEDEEDTDMGDSMGLLDMMHYLLNYKKKGASDDDERDRNKTLIRILEIEPCNDFIWKDSTATTVFFPPSRYEVEVDCMTTQHFNGAKTDLVSDYDIVYVGMTKGKFNQEAANLELGEDDYVTYNDSDFEAKNRKLAGKIYLHVGDLVKAASDMQLRFSGNDISHLKDEELQKFAKSGGVLILDDLLKNFKNKKYTRTVDSSSNITSLLKVVANRSNVESYEKCKGNYNMLQEMLLASKAAFKSQMEIVETPPKYAKTSKSSTTASGSAIKQVDGEGSFTVLNESVLYFTFRINKADFDKKFGTDVDKDLNEAKYGIRLYMDINYDGQITDNEEQSELVYDSQVNGGGNNRPKSYKVSDSPYYFSFDFVKEVYEPRKLAERMNGAITWKFEIYDISDPDYCVAESGVTWYQKLGNTQDAQVIRYYQVVADDAVNSNMNLGKNSMFDKYTSGLLDYKIDPNSVTVSLSEYVKKYNDEVAPAEAKSDADAVSIFQDYDMFIVSCSDKMLASAPSGAVEFIKKLAENGFSVLYTTSSVSKDAGASAAQTVKNLLNQSRFTDADSDYTDKASYSSGQETSSNTLASTAIYKAGDYKSLEYTYATVMQEGKKASNDKKAFDNKLWSGVDYEASANSLKTKTVTQINAGKLSTYPYVIDEEGLEETCVNTKAQDFQLNMDNPGMTVWYCLGGKDNTVYGISPNDATNNYYLYTIGNVAYTSADLANITGDMEMKLFVNTLIANYEVGYFYPHVTVNAMIPLNPADPEVEIVESGSNTESILYYDAKMGEIHEQYLDYVPHATPIVIPQTPAPGSSGSSSAGTVLESMEPMDPDETEEPEPTVEPTPTPIPEPAPVDVPFSISSNNGGMILFGTNNTDESLREAQKEQLKGLGENAILVVRYSKVNQWAQTVFWNIDANSGVGGWGGTNVYGQHDYNSSSKEEIQMFTLPISDIKAKLNGAALESIVLNVGYGFEIEMVSIFNSPQQLEKFLKSSDDDDSGDTSTGNNNKITWDPKKVAQVAGPDDKFKDYMPGGDNTHIIYFTPFDNNVPNGNIHSLRISIAYKDSPLADPNDVNYPDQVLGWIKYIFRKDATGHIFRHTASADGTFTVSKRNYTVDSQEYFFFYQEKYAVTDYNYVKFEIENIKRKGLTYLKLGPEAVGDNTYVFPLD